MSLLARLYLLVALALLPALLIQGAAELSLRRDREAQARDEALRLAEFTASDVDGLLDGAATLLAALARAPAVRRGDGPACGRLLDEIGRDLRRYVDLAAVGRDGRWVCAQGGPPPESPGGAGRPAFAAGPADGGLRVAGYAVSRRLGVGVLPVSLPFLDEAGAPAGRVGLSVDLDWLARHLGQRAMPPEASLDLADRDGTLLVRLPERERAGRKLPEAARWMLGAERAGAADVADPDGTARVVGFVPPAATLDRALLVGVGLSREQAMAGVAASARRGLLLIGLGVLLALLAARVGGRAFVVRPVEILLRAAERWRAGDFRARAGPVGGARELSRLGAAFDAMAANVERHEREMGQALRGMRESETRFRQFADNSHDVIWVGDRSGGRVEYVSPACRAVFGREPFELLGDRGSFRLSVHPEDLEQVDRAMADTAGGREASVTYRIVRPDGEVRWVRDTGFPIRAADGAVVRVGGICRDVTELKRIEDERERTLQERELMLREINHRVKNNLQVIVSLLRLQAHRSASPEVRAAFEEACGRVSTITELHAALFDGVRIGAIDFGGYLRDLCARLETAGNSGGGGGQHGPVRIQVAAEPGAAVDLDRAIPLGLIVNELVSNAIKHGRPEEGVGTVRVAFARRDDRYRLSVRDDGAGLGPAGPAGGLGMQLVDGFVRRIRGVLTIDGGAGGLEAAVDFPMTAERRPDAPPDAKPQAPPG